ncbi:hypothetical protein FS749_004374 [Ceratobasidium sp. UAMH 11750]|nr:hypothetical protein FS749_004374 [Ceratobasidium sp. UAMH 11750]
MATIEQLPIEVLIDSLLPVLALRDLLALACTSKFLAAVCADDTFWKRKTELEYNFSGAESARTTGFRNVYPGGWSFHALTDDGRVLVWGVLDSQAQGAGLDNLAYSGTTVHDPVALILPQRIKSLSVGRRHAILLDAHNDAWVLRSWGRPARLVTPALDNTRPETSVVQVAAGWDVCALLTQTGDVFVVFPFRGSFDQEVEARMPEAGGEQSEVLAQGGEVRCECWDVQHHPTRLPALPRLPVLHPSTDATEDAPPRLVKIAAGEHFVVGLTDGGHVLKLNLPTSNEAELHQSIVHGNLQWDYLPKFCDVAHVRNEPGFRHQGQQEQSALEDLTVTHISAQFRTFVVYSTTGSSVVLLGKGDTTSQGAPMIVPELQNRNVISVVLGDYHYCALTASGELFSWGKYSNGALGLGHPKPGRGIGLQARLAMLPPMLHQPPRPPQQQDADVPTRVSFGHEDGVGDRYVFAVAAAGWHCGALVIDLHSSPSASGEKRPEEPRNDDARPIAQLPRRTDAPQITLPIVRGRGAPFRIGYAGRGAYAGRGHGSAGSHSGSGADAEQ